MKERRVGRSASVGVVVGLSLVALLLAGQGVSFANAPNTMPYAESFESYAPGTEIVDMNGDGTNGWYGNASTSVSNLPLAVVVSTNYTFADPPITNGHTKVMSFNGTITNVFEAPPSPLVTNVFVDTMVQAGFQNSDPPVDTSVQCAVYVNTNGLLVIRHAKFAPDFLSVSQVWTALTNGPTLASNEWFRLTIKMDYMSGLYASQEHYFQISVNSGAPITDTAGYTSTSPNPGDEDGPWFLCADSGGGTGQTGPNHQYFSSVGLMGVGSLDDLVITSEGTSTNVLPPTPPEILAVVSAGTSNAVAWGSTAGKQYSVYRSTDLLSSNPVPGGWMLKQANIPADPSGTVIWWDTDLPLSPTNSVFYKAAIQP